ncbi:hypothetical protein K469DRAFT_805671 [Zopfia rhizophila CBS 207.26]|uniref:Uncharacterized protein n=1 Tax=Zopfia rhizophila CBS 207.26 TaxID=1314779 RepID=A0A6A6DGJ9_9PEZI|nr:hypothetical protein K469DRAFT_805671 [Zopfia rhizophila CBS 207.26]
MARMGSLCKKVREGHGSMRSLSFENELLPAAERGPRGDHKSHVTPPWLAGGTEEPTLLVALSSSLTLLSFWKTLSHNYEAAIFTLPDRTKLIIPYGLSVKWDPKAGIKVTLPE